MFALPVQEQVPDDRDEEVSAIFCCNTPEVIICTGIQGLGSKIRVKFIREEDEGNQDPSRADILEDLNPGRIARPGIGYDDIKNLPCKGFPAISYFRQQEYGDITAVAVYIQRIRKKIEAKPDNPLFIETVYGKGYRFNGEAP